MLDFVVPSRHDATKDMHATPASAMQAAFPAATLERETAPGQPVFRTVRLKDGHAAAIHRLDSTWLGRMVDLQKTDTGDNIIFRNRAYLEKALARGDLALGITHRGRLLAMAVTSAVYWQL